MRRSVIGSATALASMALLTATMLPLRSHLSIATTALVLVVPVVIGVVCGGFGVGRALGVGVERLATGELVFGEIRPGPGLIHARDGGVEAAEGRDGFHRVIGAEGQGHTCVEKGLPGVGGCSASGSEPVLGPVHVGEQVAGLHGGEEPRK